MVDRAGNGLAVGSTDQITGAQSVLDYEHHEIHGGSHYYVGGFETKQLNETIEWTVTTPDTTKWSHFLFTFNGSDGIQFELYEGTTGVTGGTTITPQNSNRNYANASVLTIVKDATVTLGTQIDGASSGANNRIGLIERDDELVLKQNETYTFLVRSLGNSNIVSYRGRWYEHTNRT